MGALDVIVNRLVVDLVWEISPDNAQLVAFSMLSNLYDKSKLLGIYNDQFIALYVAIAIYGLIKDRETRPSVEPLGSMIHQVP